MTADTRKKKPIERMDRNHRQMSHVSECYRYLKGSLANAQMIERLLPRNRLDSYRNRETEIGNNRWRRFRNESLSLFLWVKKARHFNRSTHFLLHLFFKMNCILFCVCGIFFISLHFIQWIELKLEEGETLSTLIDTIIQEKLFIIIILLNGGVWSL